MTPERIRALREHAGVSQKRFAELLSEIEVTVKRQVNYAEVSYWETGERKPGELAQAALNELARRRGITLE